jgi:hypothetical protein
VDHPAPSTNGFLGTANGFVPGRPVLEVPGFDARQASRFMASSSRDGVNTNPLSRLRIFSGTSNPVRAAAALRTQLTASLHRRGGVKACRPCSRQHTALHASTSNSV